MRRAFSILFFLEIVLLSVVFIRSGKAELPYHEITPSLWFRGSMKDGETFVPVLQRVLWQLEGESSLLFEKDQRFSILIDPEWHLSAGYWSNLLQAPDGSPAILLTPQSFAQGDAPLLMLLTHELTHLVHFQFRPKEESWVREGLAMLAEYAVSGLVDPAWTEALYHPETTMIADFNTGTRPAKRSTGIFFSTFIISTGFVGKIIFLRPCCHLLIPTRVPRF